MSAKLDGAMRKGPLTDKLPALAQRPSPQDNLVLDCTGCERFGLRGPGVTDWLAEAGLAIPAKVNAALTLACGTAILRLGQQEILLTSPPGESGERLRELRSAWRASELAAKGYDAYREEGWAWFVVSGPAAADLMPRLSMMDLRPRSFAVGEVAQTRALQMDAVVARLDRFGTTSYDIFLDVASAAFAFDVLGTATSGLGKDFRLAALHPSA